MDIPGKNARKQWICTHTAINRKHVPFVYLPRRHCLVLRATALSYPCRVSRKTGERMALSIKRCFDIDKSILYENPADKHRTPAVASILSIFLRGLCFTHLWKSATRVFLIRSKSGTLARNPQITLSHSRNRGRSRNVHITESLNRSSPTNLYTCRFLGGLVHSTNLYFWLKVPKSASRI